MIWNRTLFVTLFIILLLVFAVWRLLFYVPLDWVRYTNTQGYPYSFSYPKEWIVNECGNGEVIVAKKRLEKCYYVLNAPESYMSDVYFHVFLPKGKQLSFNWSEGNTQERIYAGVLKNWKGKHWYPDDLFGYKIISMDSGPLATDSSILVSQWVPDNQRIYPQIYAQPWFDIGYMANNMSEWDIYSVTVSFKDH